MRAYEPALDPDRSRDSGLFWGIPTIGRFPYHGSAVEIWDSGPGRVQAPPVGDVPPTAGATNIEEKAVVGAPVDALVDLAAEVNADLLVVGNVGLSTIAGRLLGSVPANVARRSKTDVLIVHTTP